MKNTQKEKENNKTPRAEKLSIYLANNPQNPDHEIIKIHNAKEPIHLDIKNTKRATLYIKKQAAEKHPPWTELFTITEKISADQFGKTSTVGAVLLIETQESIFILSFGTGHHLIVEKSVERNFGMRVAINSINIENFKSIDKASYDHTPLIKRNQSPKEIDIISLDIDTEMEILNAVTGRSTVNEFGKTVTGRDALTISAKTTLNDLHTILSECINRFKKPIPESLEWIENISQVRDQTEIDVCEIELENLLSTKDYSRMWLGEPEIVDWENQIGYTINTTSNTRILTTLSLEKYISDSNQSLSIAKFKEDTIYIKDGDYSTKKHWSAYRCLYAEIDYNNKKYILRNGNWYKINPDFVEKINTQVSKISTYSFSMPIYEHDNESEYNTSVCQNHPSIELMDKKCIKTGRPNDKIEHCDLIRNGNEFIHVKFYRSSSCLSHLFAQGLVAAESFIDSEDYREKLNKKLPNSIRLNNTSARPEPQDYKIVYAIATTKKLPEELPFFSKVTLKNAMTVLRKLNYNFYISQIKIDQNYLKKVKSKNKTKI